MPALYAHDRFGREVSGRLDGEWRELIEKYDRQYQIGLQGPDIFFFYGAHTNNKVVRFGEHLHQVSAYPFFQHAVKVIQETGRDSGEYAYLLGFLCHFVLDSECHPYVEEMIQESGVQHLEIEAEFEKLLLRLDGRDPVAFPLDTLVPTDEETARSIQPFYPVKMREPEAVERLKDRLKEQRKDWQLRDSQITGVSRVRRRFRKKSAWAEEEVQGVEYDLDAEESREFGMDRNPEESGKQGVSRNFVENKDPGECENTGRRYLTVATIRRSLKDLRAIKKFLTAPQPLKQDMINTVMKLAGVYPQLNGVMLQRFDNPNCAESNAGLKLRYDASVEIALRMIACLDESVCTGARLPERFDRTFS